MIKSEEEVKQLVKDLEDYYHNFKTQCETEELYYNLKYDVERVEGYPIQRPETARTAIDDAANQIDTANIRVEVRARNPGSRAQEQAERQRKYLLGCWHRIFSNQGLILGDASKHEELYGVTFMKVLCDLDLWGNRPLIKKNEDIKDFRKRLEIWRENNLINFPFVLCVTNPKTVMPDPSISGSQFYIEKYKRRVIDVRNRWPNWASSKKLNDEVEWVEYWDKDVTIYLCDKKVVQEARKHNYGFIPYVKAEAGYGLQSANALPEEKWRGLLNPLHDRIEQEARLETMMEAVLKTSAYPQTFIQGPTEYREAMEKIVKGWAAHPAVINVLPLPVDEVKFDQVAPFNIPPEAAALLNISTSRLQQATVAPVLGGMREKGVRAGYEVAMRAGLARRKYTVPIFNLERACEQINERFLKYVDNGLIDEITVWGKTQTESFDQTITTGDIRGYYENHVTLSSISPEEEDRRGNLGRVLYQSGGISGRTFRRDYIQLESPIEEEKQILIEQLLKSPQVQQALAQALMQTEQLQEQVETMGGQPWSPAGNMGIPPSPMPRPDEMQRVVRPIMPGTPEEADLRARQMMEPGAGMPPQRPMPPQLRGGM